MITNYFSEPLSNLLSGFIILSILISDMVAHRSYYGLRNTILILILCLFFFPSVSQMQVPQDCGPNSVFSL